MSEPSERAESEGKRNRDERGYFLPGHSLPGPGRPRGYDFQTIAVERAKARGQTIEQVVGEVMDDLCAATKVPSCAAAAGKVLLDRLCGPVRQEVTGPGGTGLVLRVVTGLDAERVDGPDDMLPNPVTPEATQ